MCDKKALRLCHNPCGFTHRTKYHSASQKALETLGLGRRALRVIPSDTNFKMSIPALEQAIKEDRAEGWLPVCVIATAGTTNTGAIDDIPAVADLCQ